MGCFAYSRSLSGDIISAVFYYLKGSYKFQIASISEIGGFLFVKFPATRYVIYIL